MLRLTLRTLLAYLDDTLEPTQARDIGQRIKDSEAAQELIERCKTVMRRRRLTAPSPDPDEASLDANIVAAYLDNSLPPEKVGKAERQFLKSDTELAEVACVHQILSMVLGKSAEVSREARNRAYSLVGGAPERPVLARPISPAPKQPDARPVDARLLDSQPLPLAIPAYNAGMGAKGVAGTVAIVLLLTCALAVVVWKVITPPGDNADISDQIALGPGLVEHPEMEPEPASEPETPAAPIEAPALKDAEDSKETKAELETPALPLPEAISPPSEKAALEPKEESETPAVEKDDGAPKPEPPPAPPVVDATIPLGRYRTPGSVLLKQTPRDLQRIRQDGLLFAGETLINLEGFRSQVYLPSEASLEFVDLVRVAVEPSPAEALAMELQRGRVVIRGAEEPIRILLRFHARNFTLNISGPSPLVGLEVALDDLLEPKRSLKIQAVRGDVEVIAMDGAVYTVPAGNLFVQPEIGEAEIQTVDAFWNWISTQPDHALKRSADNLAAVLPYGEGMELDQLLREQLSARTRDVRRLAVRALAATHSVETLVDAMGSPNDSEIRQTAIQSLREAIHYSPALLPEVRDNLLLLHEERVANTIAEMLVGYNAAERAKKEVYERLVTNLQDDRLVVRELAIYNLKLLTGRDMGYQADATLLRRNTPVSQWNRWLAELNERSLPVKPAP